MTAVCGMDLIVDGWFIEKNNQWPGQATSLEVDEVLLNTKSEFQDVLIFKSKSYGKVLVLDGVIQITELDECSYSEMLTHVPMFAHGDPRKVLIIGGGDGAVLREVLCHEIVESVTLVEIDKVVIESCREHFSWANSAWSDDRVNLQVGDGVKYVKRTKERYDVVIIDSSDPVGPAEGLFTKEFYENVAKILNPSGVVCGQGEDVWLELDLIKTLMDTTKHIFSHRQYFSMNVPTYPGGQIGGIVYSNHDVSRPVRPVLPSMKMKYYTSELHRASFVLPMFARMKLGLEPNFDSFSSLEDEGKISSLKTDIFR